MKNTEVLKRLLGYLKAHWLRLALVMVSAILSTAFMVLAPFVVGKVTTTLFASIADGTFYWKKIIWLLSSLVALYLISQLFTFLQGFVMAKITSKVMETLRREINEKMHRLKLDYYDTHTHGDILSIITNDVDTINNTISQNLTSIVTQVATAVGVLLMRFYELNGGSILVDGVKITDMSREELRNRFGMVLQDTWLFEGSIADNIGYAKDHMEKEKIKAAAKSACAHSFIKTLPGGYDMVLGKGAENISQGERQLLTIARAIAADPEIMILDEATSNVDTHTEVLIQKAMAELMKGRTSFVIAHRLSTIRDADMILYMEDGDIKEVGNYEELMEKKGKYAALYMSQFG